MRSPRFYRYSLDVGDKVVLIYLVSTYILPMCLGAIYFSEINSSYKIFYPNILQIVCLVLLLLCYFLLRPLIFCINFRPIKPLSSIIRALMIRLGRFHMTFALMTLILAFYWASSGYNLYRYTDEGMSSNLSLMLLIGIVLGLIVKIYFFKTIFIDEPSVNQLPNILLALSLVLMVSGVFSVLFALAMLFYSLSPRHFLGFIFTGEIKNENKSFTDLFFLMIILFIFGFFSFLIGNAIKSNSLASAVKVFVNIDYAETFYLYLIERISSSYYSFAYSLTSEFAEVAPSSFETLGYIISTFFYRLDLIMGGFLEIQRPEITSMMKINYIVLSEYAANEREGTSAGVLGSFSYIFALPLNIIFSAVFLLVIARFFNQINYRGKGKKVTFLGSFLLLYFILPIFESPFDLLLIIDDGFIYIASIFLLSMPYLKYRTSVRSVSI